MMKNKIKKLIEFYKDAGYSKKFTVLFVIIELTAIAELVIVPNIIKRILNIEIPRENINGLIALGIIYIIYLIIQCYLILKHCNIRCILKRKIQRNLREKVFNKLQEVKKKFYDDNEMGVIMQFLQSDTKDAGALFPEIITEMFFMGLVRFSIIAIFLMFIDLRITLYILGIYIIGFFITIYFNKKTMKIINEIRKINIEIYSHINEGVYGFLTIKILNIIDKKEKELENKLKEYNKSNNKLEKIVSKYNNIFLFITSFSTAIIIYYAGIDVMQRISTYAKIMLLMEYGTNQLKYEFNWFIEHLTDFNKSFFTYSKILDFINLNDVEDLETGEELESINSIEFNKVYFSYNENQKNIINFNLKLEQGEKIALVGKTGSGKTTITSLLCRFYEPMKGEILINDKNYNEYKISSLRKKIGYVMQEVQIFPNTIIDNIRYVNEKISITEIKNIFKKLKLHNKIEQLENGYNTDIYNNPEILSTRRKATNKFCENNGDRYRCNYFG